MIKAPAPTKTQGAFKDFSNHLNFATFARHGKDITTQVAEFALWGHAVHWLVGGGFLVCKCGHTFHAVDFAELRMFALRLGVSQ